MEPREVMPGVTMIDFRGGGDRPRPADDAAGVPVVNVDAVQAQIRELRNQIKHLLRSNAELEEALAAEYDEDFAQAVAENKEVVLRKELLIRELQEQLPHHLRPPQQDPGSARDGDATNGSTTDHADLSEGLDI